MLRFDRGGVGQNERESAKLPVGSRGSAAVFVYKQHGKSFSD
jgi:hypothetical protein